MCQYEVQLLVVIFLVHCVTKKFIDEIYKKISGLATYVSNFNINFLMSDIPVPHLASSLPSTRMLLARVYGRYGYSMH